MNEDVDKDIYWNAEAGLSPEEKNTIVSALLDCGFLDEFEENKQIV